MFVYFMGTEDLTPPTSLNIIIFKKYQVKYENKVISGHPLKETQLIIS